MAEQYKSKFTGQQIDEAVEKTLSASGGVGLYLHELSIACVQEGSSYQIDFQLISKSEIAYDSISELADTHITMGYFTDEDTSGTYVMLYIQINLSDKGYTSTDITYLDGTSIANMIFSEDEIRSVSDVVYKIQ